MTRDERAMEIGRTAKDASRPMSMCASDDHRWQMIGLAAVSRAREIDTCETCKRYNDAYWNDTGDSPCLDMDVEFDPTKDGCNRHQPKDET